MISDTGSMNIVPQQARAHNARRIKDEIELDKVRAGVRAGPKVDENGAVAKFVATPGKGNASGGKSGGKSSRQPAAGEA